MPEPIRLAYLASHPIQYQAPLLRYIVQHSDIDLTAFFLSDMSVRGYMDAEFKHQVKWDVPLLEGYKHEFLPAIGSTDNIDDSFRPFTYGIRKALKKGRFDVLWSHGYSKHANLRALLTARALGMKTFVRSDIQLGTAKRTKLTAGLKNAVVRWTFRRVDGFLAVGELNKEYYVHYGAPPERVFMMPHAVDNDFFQCMCEEAAPKREAFRASLGLEPGRPVILYASKFTQRKKAIDVLEGYIRLSPDGKAEPRPYMLFVGDGEQRPQLEERIRQTGWGSIKMLGFKNQQELPPLFDLCDVFVLVSAREPYGLIINEVMNAAKPVIVSDEVGARHDLVKEGVNGYVVGVGDTASLADRMKTLTDDLELGRRMGQESLQIVNHWSYKEDLEALQHALSVVLGR